MAHLHKITTVLFLLFSLLMLNASLAQTIDDIGRISLTPCLPENIPINARELLQSKLNQIVTQNGLGADGLNKRFILTASIQPTTKDIVAGPPQLIAQNLEIVLLIGDAIEGRKFETIMFSVKGVGTNEDKATIDAIAKLKPNAENISAFVSKGKQKILEYYMSNCTAMQEKAKALASQNKYNESIALLMDMPEVAGDCKTTCLSLASSIFKEQQDIICKQLLFEAQNSWAVQQDLNNAIAISNKLAFVKQQSTCSKDIVAFLTTVNNKLLANEQSQLAFQLKLYEDEKKYKQEELNTMKQIALAYAKNQPKTVNNNYLLIK